MSEDTRLWVWFIFNSGLRPPRAKALLARWQAQGASLAAVLAQLPQAAAQWGLSPDEAQALRPVPAELPDVPAVRWDEPLYPRGLQRRLAEVMRPALLFVAGAASLLQRPLVYLPPELLDEAAQDAAREALGMLAGEPVLPAVFEGSPIAELLLEELATAEGEMLLWLRGGRDSWTPTLAQQALLDAGRLVALTPLPPPAPAIPEWMPFLEQVALTAADFVLFWQGDEAALGALPHARYGELERLAMWLETAAAPSATAPGAVTAPVEEPPAPELDPAEVLAKLERVGRVPKSLRERLQRRARS